MIRIIFYSAAVWYAPPRRNVNAVALIFIVGMMCWPNGNYYAFDLFLFKCLCIGIGYGVGSICSSSKRAAQAFSCLRAIVGNPNSGRRKWKYSNCTTTKSCYLPTIHNSCVIFLCRFLIRPPMHLQDIQQQRGNGKSLSERREIQFESENHCQFTFLTLV